MLDLVEVAAQHLERIPFLLDLKARTNSKAAQQGYGRTPALQGVHQQKTGDQNRQNEPLPSTSDPQNRAHEHERRSFGSKHAVNIPLAIQFLDAGGEGLAIL